MNAPNLLDEVLKKLQTFGPQSTAADLSAIVADLQSIEDAAALINDATVLESMQQNLATLRDERVKLANLYWAFASQWQKLDDAINDVSLAIALQQAASPNASQDRSGRIKALLQTLLKRIDATSPVERLAGPDARMRAEERVKPAGPI